jgi:hypothetical protein
LLKGAPALPGLHEQVLFAEHRVEREQRKADPHTDRGASSVTLNFFQSFGKYFFGSPINICKKKFFSA